MGRDSRDGKRLYEGHRQVQSEAFAANPWTGHQAEEGPKLERSQPAVANPRIKHQEVGKGGDQS